MGAKTAQQETDRREGWANKFVTLTIRGILPLIERGKRDGETILKMLQIIKDGQDEYQQLYAFINNMMEPATTDLFTFFANRPGLYVSPGFRAHILAPALEMEEAAPAQAGMPYVPPTGMTDTQILENLGEDCMFPNARAFCRYLEYAITAQWGGTSGGNLLTNGYANIFYVRGRNEKCESEAFTVCVYWYIGLSSLDVDVYQLGARSWSQGIRAFPFMKAA
ncbi:MAG: hypothetical protein AMXMBFR44_6630 [Candidatus Campbellbacteria bacterium]